MRRKSSASGEAELSGENSELRPTRRSVRRNTKTRVEQREWDDTRQLNRQRKSIDTNDLAVTVEQLGERLIGRTGHELTNSIPQSSTNRTAGSVNPTQSSETNCVLRIRALHMSFNTPPRISTTRAAVGSHTGEMATTNRSGAATCDDHCSHPRQPLHWCCVNRGLRALLPWCKSC